MEFINLTDDFNALKASARNSVAITQKATAVSLRNFTDDQVLNASVYFPKSAKNPSVVWTILSDFYKFYFHGDLTEDASSIDVIFAPIALIPPRAYNHRVTTVWNNEDYSDDDLAFFGVPSDKIARRTTPAFRTNPSDRRAARFAASIASTLVEWDPKRGVNSEAHKLLRLTSFLALTFCRVAIHRKRTMIEAFEAHKYKKDLDRIVEWRIENFSPPSQKCVDKLEVQMEHENTRVAQLFAKVVSLFMTMKRTKPFDVEIVDFLGASLLNDSQGNGMKLVVLLEFSCTRFHKTWREMRELTYFSHTKETWDVLSEFCEKYCDQKNKQYGYFWARIINHRYLKNLDAENHYFLAAVLAEVIDKLGRQPGIWRSVWAKHRVRCLDSPKCCGRALINGILEE